MISTCVEYLHVRRKPKRLLHKLKELTRSCTLARAKAIILLLRSMVYEYVGHTGEALESHRERERDRETERERDRDRDRERDTKVNKESLNNNYTS